MIVKWHNKISKEEALNGGGPQGGYFGNLEFSAQSNESANCVEINSRLKSVDDLSTLEKSTSS